MSDNEGSGSSATKRWTAFQTFLAVVQAGLIALIGYMLNGRLEAALKIQQANLQERQITIANLTQMSGLLKTISSDTTKDEDRAQATAQLAMFGSDAVFPMFVIAAARSDNSPKNAIGGLRLLAIEHQDKVCKVLLSAQHIPHSLNEIRKNAIDELTADLRCAQKKASS